MDCAIAGARHQLKTRQPFCQLQGTQGKVAPKAFPNLMLERSPPQSASLLVLVLVLYTR